MRRASGPVAKAVIVTSLLLASSVVTASVVGNFEDYSWITVVDTETGAEILSPLGTVALKNERGEVIAQNDDVPRGATVVEITPIIGNIPKTSIIMMDGYRVVKGKQGTSFKYEPFAGKTGLPQWQGRKPTEWARLGLDRANQWSIQDPNFMFLMRSSLYYGHQVHTIFVVESITRASVITLSSGKYELFGYAVEAKRDGAWVKFGHGKIVASNDCVVGELWDDVVPGKAPSTSLKYDGVYRRTTTSQDNKHETYYYYLRFYADGTVIEAGPDVGTGVLGAWFDKERPGISKGWYGVRGNRFALTTDDNGRYSHGRGEMQGEVLYLDWLFREKGEFRGHLRYDFVRAEPNQPKPQGTVGSPKQ